MTTHRQTPGQLALTADPIDERFFDFHHAHPEVYDALKALAFEVRASGAARIGIATLYERLRYDRVIAGAEDGEGGYALNNDFRSRYARLLMANEPDLAGLFETRITRADREEARA